jgi:quercetin dioxygenase-like cupin family protein
MTFRTTCLVFSVAALCACASGPRAVVGPPAGKPARARVAGIQALPPLDGRRLRATLLELSYEPGGSSPAHSHSCPVMVHVIEGAIRTRLKGQPEAIYRAGDTFYEEAHGVHELSANASQHAPARFLAFFVCDRDTELSVPPPAVTGSGS